MDKKVIPFLSFQIVFLIFGCNILFPCTTFVLKTENNLLFGCNLDWQVGTGLLMTNPRNVEKIALIDSTENPVKWISKYGSITFNQVGRDLPFGGMNETGLVVEQMSLSGTEYPIKDNRYAIQACQWIQYQLDNCTTIEEVINSDKFLRIVDKISFFHFLICDSTGTVAVIEFIDGKMVAKIGKQLPINALANSTYVESISTFSNKISTDNNRSLYNFCTAANMIQNYSGDKIQNDIDYSFDILKSVAQGYGTKWSIVYDIKNMKIYFKVFETPTLVEKQIIFLKEQGIAKIKQVELKGIDFNCSLPGLVFDLEEDVEGLVNPKLIEYTTEINRKFISKAFKYFEWLGIPIHLTDEEIDGLAKYPESFKCINY